MRPEKTEAFKLLVSGHGYPTKVFTELIPQRYYPPLITTGGFGRSFTEGSRIEGSPSDPAFFDIEVIPKLADVRINFFIVILGKIPTKWEFWESF